MQVEQLPFANTALGKGVTNLIRSLAAATEAARQTYKFARNSTPTVDPTIAAQKYAQAVLNLGLKVRSAPLSPKETSLGWWKPIDAYHPPDTSIQQALRSREARFSKTTSGAGNTPYSMAPAPEITLRHIADAHRRCWVTGRCDWKADLDSRIRREDTHVLSTDRTRRVPLYKAPIRIRPKNAQPVSVLTAAAVREAIANLDGFRSSLGELGVIACDGYAVQEACWREQKLTVAVGGKTLTLDSEIVGSLEPVLNRNLVFDVVNDKPWLNMGAEEFIDLTDPTLQKFLFVRGDGGEHARMRGYGWAVSWLTYLGGLSTEKLGTIVETYGVATPFATYADIGHIQEEEYAAMLDVLENMGTGKPAIVSGKFKIDHSPVPSGLAPIHTQFLGYIRAEQSKAILGATLQVESSASGVGSYAQTDVHLGQQAGTQGIDATLIGEAFACQLIKWLCQANAYRWARVFSQHTRCTPEEIESAVPLFELVLNEETPQQRLSTFQGVKGLGMEFDPEQVREELGVRAPLNFQLGQTPDPKAFTVSADEGSQPAEPSTAATEERDIDAEATPSEAARLAAEMTQYGIERCPHDKPNRCRLCGIERVHSVVPGENGEAHGWKLAWKAIDVPMIAADPPAQ